MRVAEQQHLGQPNILGLELQFYFYFENVRLLVVSIVNKVMMAEKRSERAFDIWLDAKL